MATVSASSTAAANGPRPLNADPPPPPNAPRARRASFAMLKRPCSPANPCLSFALLVTFCSAPVVYFYSALDSGEIRRAGINNIQPNSVAGSFSFNGGGTGNAYADFLLGYLNKSSVEVQSNYLVVRTWADALFAQDDWKVSPKLTLNLGLRWQYDPSWTEAHHQLASFNPYTLAWIQNGVNGAPEGSIETHWKEYAPRVGFSWNPRGGFVVHGGYGITYPGVFGHGRGGDGNPSPNVLATTQINPGTYITNLPTIILPSVNPTPLAIWQGEYAYYTPYQIASGVGLTL